MKRLSVAVLSALVLGVFSAGAMAQDAAAPPPPPPKAVKPGDAVPAWKAMDVAAGKEVTSEQLKDKNYALVFVNSSCASCRSELAEIKKRQFKGLEVFVMSVDASQEKAMAVYKDALSVPYPVLDDSKMDVSDIFDFSFTPASVIVKKGNVLDKRFIGYAKRNQADIVKAFDEYAK